MSEVKFNEKGRPLKDGYLSILMQDGFGRSCFERRISYETAGYSLEDINCLRYMDLESEARIYIPWHRIIEVREVPNSDDYVEAINLFRLTCNHVWDEEHHLLEVYCKHFCIDCGKVKALKHDDTDGD